MLGWLLRRRSPGPAIPEALWQATLADLPFLAALSTPEQQRLQRLAQAFLAGKEFHGAGGLQVTDAMALSVAAQACLPLLHMAPLERPERALAWYDDFVGIVLHPGQVLARREQLDEQGVVHEYQEELAGEAMPGGPVMLSWCDVAVAGRSAAEGYNVVVHEFVHKMDLRDGAADGCPPLPADCLGAPSARAARARWLATLEAEHQVFRDQVIVAERFGGAAPWLDPYAAEHISEFFAVACEAYFVNRPRFAQDFGRLCALFDAFFRPGQTTA